MEKSVLQPWGTFGGPCSYCDFASGWSPGGRVSYMARGEAGSVTVDAYDCMLDYGWARMGTRITKPLNAYACCPNYQIRLEASKFAPTKAQRKTLRRRASLLETWPGHAAGAGAGSSAAEAPPPTPPKPKKASPPTLPTPLADHLRTLVVTAARRAGGAAFSDTYAARVKVSPPSKKAKVAAAAVSNAAFLLGQAMGRPASEVAPSLRDAVNSLPSLGLPPVTASVGGPGLLNLSFDAVALAAAVAPPEVVGAPLPVAAPPGTDPAPGPSSAPVTEAPVVAADGILASGVGLEARPVDGLITVDHLPAELTEEAFELYREFSVKVHRKDWDDMDMLGYDNFLCVTALRRRFVADSERGAVPVVHHELDDYFGDLGGGDAAGWDMKQGFGSFHQHYRMNGKLIAVSVVDITPSTFTSVFFFYDPSLRYLELGKLSAMREMQWVRLAQRTLPDLRFVNMCMYVPGCHRMSYKVGYGPCELLCPKHWVWVAYNKDTAARIAAKRNAQLVDIPADLEAMLGAEANEAASMAALSADWFVTTPMMQQVASNPMLMEMFLPQDVAVFVKHVGVAAMKHFRLDVTASLRRFVKQVIGDVPAPEEAPAADTDDSL